MLGAVLLTSTVAVFMACAIHSLNGYTSRSSFHKRLQLFQPAD